MESSSVYKTIEPIIKSSYSTQRKFLEKLFAEIMTVNDIDILKMLHTLGEIIEDLDFPFVLLLNNETYLNILVTLYYEDTFSKSIELVFQQCMGKFKFEKELDSIKLILQYSGLIGMSMTNSIIKVQLPASDLEKIYLEYVNLINDCIFLKSFIENIGIGEEDLDDNNVREIVNRIRMMINSQFGFNGVKHSPYIFNFLQELSEKLVEFEEFLTKFIKNPQTNSSITPDKVMNKYESSLNPRFRTSFYFDELIHLNEGLHVEYKHYRWPLSPSLVEVLKNQICGFLNSQGGRIYIGITDDQVVKGVFLKAKKRDLARNEIVNCTSGFYPKCRTNKIEVAFVPVKNHNTDEYIPDVWIIKIIVRQGDVDKLYSVSQKGYNSYVRMPGQVVQLTAEEISEELIKRKMNPKNAVDENEFIDKEPEKPLETKGSKVLFNSIFSQFNKNKSNVRTVSNVNVNKSKKDSQGPFTLSVQNIPKTANKNNVLIIFKDTKYLSERVFVDKDGCCLGWAFFNFSSESDALDAIKKTKNACVNGTRINIKLK